MALLVQKFGGTSVATQAHINHAADIVAKARHAGHDVVVVVSAMSGETDKLIDLAHQMSESPDPREYAALVTTGEQVSMALMAMALINRGIAARSYTGAQARIYTCSRFKNARIQSIDTQPLLADLKKGRVVVLAGFQGIDKEGNITTLGRGGSDTTAVAIAAALKADECQIYTDVDGVYSTDPRVVADARRLDEITFEEMLELSSLGAKVLQIRSVEFAGKYHVPLRVLSSAKEGPGTLITYHKHARLQSHSVTGIALSRNEAAILLANVPNLANINAQLVMEMNAIGVNVDMFTQQITKDNHLNFQFAVPQDELQMTLALLDKRAVDLNVKELRVMEKMAKISLVGAGLKSHPEVVPMLFKTLTAINIPIHLMTSSEIKISMMIDQTQLEQAVQALHEVFCLAYTEEITSSLKASASAVKAI